MKIFTLFWKQMALFVVGILILVICIFSYSDSKIWPWGLGSDSLEYWEQSTHIFQMKEIFNSPSTDLVKRLDPVGLKQLKLSTVKGLLYNMYRTPFYAFIGAILRSIVDQPISLLSINLFSYIGILFYSLVISRVFIKNIRLQFAFLFFVTFSPVYFTLSGVQTDSLTSFLLLAFSVHLILFIKNESKHLRIHLFFSVLYASLCFYTRADTFIFLFLFTSFVILLDL